MRAVPALPRSPTVLGDATAPTAKQELRRAVSLTCCKLGAGEAGSARRRACSHNKTPAFLLLPDGHRAVGTWQQLIQKTIKNHPSFAPVILTGSYDTHEVVTKYIRRDYDPLRKSCDTAAESQVIAAQYSRTENPICIYERRAKFRRSVSGSLPGTAPGR